MLQDVARIVCLMLPLLAAFGAALHVLLKEATLGADGAGCSTAGDPDAQAELHAEFGGSLGLAFVVLMEVTFGGADARYDCLRQSHVGWLAWTVMMVFALVMIVLLLNVVIATMSKTFDTIHDQLDVHAKFVQAKLIQAAARLPPAPPPLNLLGIPSRAVLALLRWRRRRRQRRARAHGRSGSARHNPAHTESHSSASRLLALARKGGGSRAAARDESGARSGMGARENTDADADAGDRGGSGAPKHDLRESARASEDALSSARAPSESDTATARAVAVGAGTEGPRGVTGGGSRAIGRHGRHAAGSAEWREQMIEAALDFMLERIVDADADDRWRMRITRRLAALEGATARIADAVVGSSDAEHSQSARARSQSSQALHLTSAPSASPSRRAGLRSMRDPVGPRSVSHARAQDWRPSSPARPAVPRLRVEPGGGEEEEDEAHQLSA